eukprot:1934163-Alexandrium_andersonii.AAC.1
MAVSEAEIVRALTTLVDWAASRFCKRPQASFAALAGVITMDTGVPCSHLAAAAWGNLHWGSGQPRFRVL